MKKCASCSKDLPEAALHCVFCGAKQAAAPAVQSSVAKTAFGYSANDVMAHLGKQQPPAPAPQPYQPPRAHPVSQPPPQQQPYQPPRPQSGSQPPPMGGYGQGSGLAPTAAAQAPTMFVQNGPGQGMSSPMPGNQGAGPYAPPGPAPYQPPPPASQPPPAYGGYGAGPAPMAPQPIGGMGIHSPPQPTPAPLPTAQPPPYLASQTAARAGRPIEPWKDSLRLMMFIFGAVALAAFAAPLVTEPSMKFQWDAIIHGAGTEKIPGLVWAAAALLSIAIGAIPMASFPRGLLAMVLGLAGVFVPVGVMGGFSDWKALLTLISFACMIPGLLARHEYTESSVPRVLVTIGVVLTLVQFLIPDHGQIPLVLLIKALIHAGSGMERVIIPLAQLVLAVLCLLVWMPGPATAGAKIFAWAWILFPLAAFTLVFLGGRGSPIDHLTKTPGMVLAAFVPSLLYAVLVGYGGATVLGKQLE